MARPQKRHRSRHQETLDTRQALIEAALELVDRDKSFDALSLREVTRHVGVVPTTFYRHFPDMESLGLELVDQSLRTMRQLLKVAREAPLEPEDLIRRSAETFVTYVRAHRRHFLFLSRERFGGVPAIREAINHEIELIISELATDLGRFPVIDKWNTEDLQMLAGLIVGAMIRVVEQVLISRRRGEDDAALINTASKQLRLVILGAPHWRSS